MKIAQKKKLTNMNTNIYQKLHQIQSKLTHLTKTEENKFQHYKYASEYQILTILKPLLAETKLILTFDDFYDNLSGGGENFTKEKPEKEAASAAASGSAGAPAAATAR